MSHTAIIFLLLLGIGQKARAELPAFSEKDNEGLNKLERIGAIEKQLTAITSNFNALEKKYQALEEKFHQLEKDLGQDKNKEKEKNKNP